jgi:pimeloyl-ACP methyl ester carboxylesterase
MAPRPVPADYPAFATLPVTTFAVGPAGERIAVHVAGELTSGRIPVLCVPGFQRNMSDFIDLSTGLRRALGDWPVVLIDLKGRGRSSDRRDKSRYVSTVDAEDLAQVLAALPVDAAIFVGQGYGGQVVMALAASHPNLVAGAALIDAGPVSDSRGLVRLRSNLRELEMPRSEQSLRAALRRTLAPEYPAVPEPMLDTLAARTHYLDARKRVQPLFDPALVRLLEPFEPDDVLVPQWPLYDALANVPLLLMRTQLTEQVRRETFEEMMRRRRDAEAYVIEAQGSPALLNTPEDVEPVAEFVRRIVRPKARAA